MPEMFPVVSSRITEMGYDGDTAIVYVRFTDGVGWCYMNVPPDVWEQFVASPSKGRFIKETLDAYPNGPAEF
jgi:KTSC domain